jgi:hypothetical protein
MNVVDLTRHFIRAPRGKETQTHSQEISTRDKAQRPQLNFTGAACMVAVEMMMAMVVVVLAIMNNLRFPEGVIAGLSPISSLDHPHLAATSGS